MVWGQQFKKTASTIIATTTTTTRYRKTERIDFTFNIGCNSSNFTSLGNSSANYFRIYFNTAKYAPMRHTVIPSINDLSAIWTNMAFRTFIHGKKRSWHKKKKGKKVTHKWNEPTPTGRERKERERKSSKKMRKLQFLSILHRKFSTDSPHIIEPIDWLSFSFSLLYGHTTQREATEKWSRMEWQRDTISTIKIE